MASTMNSLGFCTGQSFCSNQRDSSVVVSRTTTATATLLPGTVRSAEAHRFGDCRVRKQHLVDFAGEIFSPPRLIISLTDRSA
jgi:hypothetical protein